MIKLNETEQNAITKFNSAAEAYNVASDELDAIFRVRYEPLLEAGKIDEVKEIIRIMPEGVARMYAADAMRVARGDYNND